MFRAAAKVASPRILLVRHGPVALEAPGLLSFYAVARYLAAYERAGLRPGAAPPPRLEAALIEIKTVFASDAIRVAQSLAALGLNESALRDPLFAEEPLALLRLRGVWPLSFWLAASRAAELWSPDSRVDRGLLRDRADCAGAKLIAASARGSVAVIGHGWFNRAVGGALRQRGWRARPSGSGAWSCKAFVQD